MDVLITGICGFAGSTIARTLLEWRENVHIHGIDNLSRPGSETNLDPLRSLGCNIYTNDLRNKDALVPFTKIDWIIDAAANPSVLAGLSNESPSAELIDINLFATIPLLELCKNLQIPFTLLSTSRTYSIESIQSIPFITLNNAFIPDPQLVPELNNGIPESFSQDSPLSLYGTSKRCAELLSVEYSRTFSFPVWINRCGVLAGPGQFGKADQGIFSYWIHRWLRRLPLQYIGFNGHGHQVRDCLHPADLVPLLLKQYDAGLDFSIPHTLNVSGGTQSACSLKQLSDWCNEQLGTHQVASSNESRPFDLPWVVLDSTLAQKTWSWTPSTPLESILQQIAQHARANPRWLELCRAAE